MKGVLYTDGSSLGNPGPGGCAFLFVFDNKVFESGASENKTTNNRMEMLAVIKGVQFVYQNISKLKSLVIKSDSEYVIKGVTLWIHSWKKNNWKTSTKKEVLNRDLWEELDLEISKIKSSGVLVTFEHVRGHSGVALNERVDQIANTFASGKILDLFNDVEISEYPYLKDGIL